MRAEMPALSTHRAAPGWAMFCAAAFAVPAVLVTNVVAVSTWNAGGVLDLNPAVAGNPALRFAATVATMIGSPVSVDILTVVAIVIAWLRCAVAKAKRLGGGLPRRPSAGRARTRRRHPRPVRTLPITTA